MQQPGQNFVFERLENLGITEETGDTDKKVLVQCEQFRTVGLKIGTVGIQIMMASQNHPASDASLDCSALVAEKIDTGGSPHEREDPAQLRFIPAASLGNTRQFASDHRRVLSDPLQRAPHFFRGQDQIDDSSRESGSRHLRIFCRTLALNDRNAALLPYCLKAQSAIGVRAGQDHADRS